MSSQGIYITVETIKDIGVVLGLLGGAGGLVWKLFSWVNELKEMKTRMTAMETKHEVELKEAREHFEKELKELRKHHDDDMKALREETSDAFKSIQDELSLVVFGVLSSLKGQHEQGCNGPVTEAIDKLEKHINQKAHGQI